MKKLALKAFSLLLVSSVLFYSCADAPSEDSSAPSPTVTDGSGKTKDDGETGGTDGTDVKVLSIGIREENGVLTLEKGKKYQLTAEVLPKNASNKEVTWTSSDKSCATVSESGLVTALKECENVVITAKSKDGSDVSGTISFVITKEAELVKNLELWDEYGNKILNNGKIYLPNATSGGGTRNKLYVKNIGNEELIIKRPELNSGGYISLEKSYDLSEGTPKPIFSYGQSYNTYKNGLNFAKDSFFYTELGSTSNKKLGEHNDVLTYEVWQGEKKEILSVTVCVTTYDENYPKLTITAVDPELEKEPRFIPHDQISYFDFVIKNEGPYIPKNIRMTPVLSKVIPTNDSSSDVYYNSMNSDYDVSVKDFDWTMIYPDDPEKPLTVNVDTKGECGYFKLELKVTCDFYERNDVVLNGYSPTRWEQGPLINEEQSPVFWFYADSGNEFKKIKGFTPIGNIGGKPYVLASNICRLDDDGNLIDMGVTCNVNEWYIFDDNLYFVDPISSNSTKEKQTIYHIDSEGNLEELASSKNGCDFKEAVKAGNSIFFMDNNSLKYKGGIDSLCKIDLDSHEVKKIQDIQGIDVQHIYSDGSYIYYENYDGLFARGLEDTAESTKIFSERVGAKSSFVYNGKLYLNESKTSGKYYCMNGREAPEEIPALSVLNEKQFEQIIPFKDTVVLVTYNKLYRFDGEKLTELSSRGGFEVVEHDGLLYWNYGNTIYVYDGVSFRTYESPYVDDYNADSKGLFPYTTSDGTKKLYFVGKGLRLYELNLDTGFFDATYYSNEHTITDTAPYLATGSYTPQSLVWKGKLYLVIDFGTYVYEE